MVKINSVMLQEMTQYKLLQTGMKLGMKLLFKI
jgi:hypothetical protein